MCCIIAQYCKWCSKTSAVEMILMQRGWFNRKKIVKYCFFVTEVRYIERNNLLKPFNGSVNVFFYFLNCGLDGFVNNIGCSVIFVFCTQIVIWSMRRSCNCHEQLYTLIIFSFKIKSSCTTEELTLSVSGRNGRIHSHKKVDLFKTLDEPVVVPRLDGYTWEDKSLFLGAACSNLLN